MDWNIKTAEPIDTIRIGAYNIQESKLLLKLLCSKAGIVQFAHS